MPSKRVLSFVSVKGGVLKTTHSANIATQLARRGQRVLAIDLDPSGDLSASLGVSGKPEAALWSLLEEDDRKTGLEHAMIAASLDGCADRLWVVPSNARMEATEKVIETMHREFALQELIAALHADWDWVVIDTPPRMGSFPFMAMMASTDVVICARADALSYRNLNKVFSVLKHVHRLAEQAVTVHGVLLGAVERHTNLTRAFREWTSDDGLRVMPVTVAKATRSAEAPSHGAPISVLAPDHRVSVAYYELASLLLDSETTAIREAA